MSADEVSEPGRIASDDSLFQGTAVAILAAEHTVVSWNPRAERLTGYSLERLKAIGWAQLFEPMEPMQQMLEKVQAGVSTLSAGLQLRRNDGTLLLVDVECSPLRSVDAVETWVVVAMREATPAQEHQHDAARLSLLGCLAGFLSHEIRNPLNAIFLHLDIVDEELRQPTLGDRTQAEQSLATMKVEVVRLHDLMQDYLSLARLSDLQFEPEDVRMFLEAVAREVRDQLAARGILFHLEGLDGLGEVALHKSTPTSSLSERGAASGGDDVARWEPDIAQLADTLACALRRSSYPG